MTERGVSIIELLVALAMTAVVTAAMLPAIVLASRLQRDSAVETRAAVIASARLEMLKAAPALGEGRELVDRDGRPSEASRATYECRWTVDAAPGAPGALRIVVRAYGMGDPSHVVIATVVPDG